MAPVRINPLQVMEKHLWVLSTSSSHIHFHTHTDLPTPPANRLLPFQSPQGWSRQTDREVMFLMRLCTKWHWCGACRTFLCYSVFLKIPVLLIVYNSSSEAVLSCHTRFVLNVVTSRQQTLKCFKHFLFRRAPVSRLHKLKRGKGGNCWAIVCYHRQGCASPLSPGCPQTCHTPVDCIYRNTAILVLLSLI